jgi:fumarylacetoacetase
MDRTHDPRASSWIEVDPTSDFPIQNLPFGVFSPEGDEPRVGVAIGEYVLDLSCVAQRFEIGAPAEVFAARSLNRFAALGRETWREVRLRVFDLLHVDNGSLREDADLRRRSLFERRKVEMKVPFDIGDYVDFYSSEQHATNVGSMFRPDNPLMPNWKHLPVGYNGRASSIVVSGTPIRRPLGQTKPAEAESPVFGPTRALDFELEVGFFTGKDNPLGDIVRTKQAREYIFGLVLVNDWSARDVQRWEYQPLGPFLAKSFATTISPWVVTLDALDPFFVEGPVQDPPVLPYLRYQGKWALDIHLEVQIKSRSMSQYQRISKTNFRQMYWNMAQQLAHQASNGTNIQVGDLYASGTVSGDTPDSYGSMLELAWRGERPLRLEETGEQRSFLQDGDSVLLRGWCEGEGYRVGFGECEGTVLPALEFSSSD